MGPSQGANSPSLGEKGLPNDNLHPVPAFSVSRMPDRVLFPGLLFLLEMLGCSLPTILDLVPQSSIYTSFLASTHARPSIFRYRISLIISRTFLHETSHPKNGMRLTIEMRLTFRISVKLTVRHAYTYTVYTKSHMQVSPDLVKGKF